ncbi:uncharacterized protein LOC114541245 [Dendronephthya gigantea]|uniref:uncharacterized protein LOC114541245 n=1 Tax=Dendronephthya gigantea TaxID=151771 RepID=UPI001069E090|nr:uncharacterized protein LOC114541245 [Dendronephthya gigantea]
MHFCEQAFCLLITVIVLCGALEVNIEGCVKNCEKKFVKYPVFCETKCLQEYLGSHVKKAIEKFESAGGLRKLAAPSLVEAGWQKIRVQFNTTELKNHSEVDYILEVKPLWGRQERGQYFVVFPYTKKYFLTNHTKYTIEDLEPNTGYRVRVIALKRDGSSTFSFWSSNINTTELCEKPPCGVTNIRLELTTEIPSYHTGPKSVDIGSIFHWTPSTTFNETGKIHVLRNFSQISECIAYYYDKRDVQSEEKNVSIDTFTETEKANFSKDDESKSLYYNCWYKLSMEAVDGSHVLPATLPQTKRSWIFHVPECIKISNIRMCGCTYEYGLVVNIRTELNATFERDTSKTATGYFTWSDKMWRNGNNLTYLQFKLSNSDTEEVLYKKFYNASSKVSDGYATYI